MSLPDIFFIFVSKAGDGEILKSSDHKHSSFLIIVQLFTSCLGLKGEKYLCKMFIG